MDSIVIGAVECGDEVGNLVGIHVGENGANIGDDDDGCLVGDQGACVGKVDGKCVGERGDTVGNTDVGFLVGGMILFFGCCLGILQDLVCINQERHEDSLIVHNVFLTSIFRTCS
jgi:hypothetical protein